MMRIRTWVVTGSLCVALLGVRARAQAAPAVIAPASSTGFQLPRFGGTMQYSLTASESTSLGYYGSNETATYGNISGNVALLTKSTLHPFSLVYSGGYMQSTTGQPSQYFQSLSVSQVVTIHRWSVVGSDTLHFLPNSPTIGLSGLLGLGDLGITLPGAPPSSGTLSAYATRVDENAAVGVTRALSGRSSAGVSVAYGIERFPSANTNGALQSNQESAGASYSYRLTARDSASAVYSYSKFDYLQVNEPFTSQVVSFGYSRKWNAKLSTDVGIGPQITGASVLSGTGSTLSYAATAHAGYNTGRFSAGVQYSRAINNGAGITVGAETDAVGGSLSRTISRALSASVAVNYGRSSTLPTLYQQAFSSQAVTMGVQANRALTRTLSAYGTYNLQRQTTAGNSFSLTPQFGTSQVFGFGITYAPRTLNLGRE